MRVLMLLSISMAMVKMNVIQFENKKLYSSQFMAIVEKPNHLTGEMQVFGN